MSLTGARRMAQKPAGGKTAVKRIVANQNAYLLRFFPALLLAAFRPCSLSSWPRVRTRSRLFE
jgi:hypothetical protein